MSDNPPRNIDRKKNLIVFTVVGAVVGAVGGGVGFGDGGVNIVAGLIGLVIGAVVMGGLTFLVNETAALAPQWLLTLLAGAFFGWLFAGIIWEQQFEKKYQAQLTGLVVGLLFTLLLQHHERIQKWVAGKRDDSQPKQPDQGPSA